MILGFPLVVSSPRLTAGPSELVWDIERELIALGFGEMLFIEDTGGLFMGEMVVERAPGATMEVCDILLDDEPEKGP